MRGAFSRATRFPSAANDNGREVRSRLTTVAEPRVVLVSVVMRVYNGERYLREAIESILSQTLLNFELLVIDDGSTDGTPAILLEYAREPRLRVINQPNSGANAAARRGVQEARGVYVAIMDADDRSQPDRLGKQVAFLDENPDHVLVGSAMRIVNENGQVIAYRRYPLDDEALRSATMIHNPFGHSTICFRRAEALACGGYTTEFDGAEDFDFNVRLRALGKAANLGEALVDYRVHKGAFKVERLRTQLRDTIRLREILRKRYGYHYGTKARLVDLIQRALMIVPPAIVTGLFQVVYFRSSLLEST
jgi:glycosyltransferase involved in cell wall biosynthesis